MICDMRERVNEWRGLESRVDSSMVLSLVFCGALYDVGAVGLDSIRFASRCRFASLCALLV